MIWIFLVRSVVLGAFVHFKICYFAQNVKIIINCFSETVCAFYMYLSDIQFIKGFTSLIEVNVKLKTNTNSDKK